MSPRILLSMLLVLSAIPLLITQTVSSQSYTTITSWTTVTNQVTSMSYSTFVVATTTQTSKATLTYDRTFTLAPLSEYCYYDAVWGTYNAGDRLVGKVVTNSVMVFFVMSSAQFQTYSHGYCNRDYPAYVKSGDMVSSYSLDWVVPADGVYYFVFSNYASSGQGAGQVIGTFNLQYPSSQSVTLTLKSTLTGSNVFVTTETHSSVYSTLVQPFPSIPANQLQLVLEFALVVSIIIILVAIIVLRSRANETKKLAKGKKKERVPEGKQFCLNCGAELPLKSKFCNKCGSTQS